MKCVVKLSAEWCSPCKQLEPIFNEIKDELESYSLMFETITEDNVEFSELSSKFGVRNIPTILIVDDFRTTLYGRITGLHSKEDLKKKIIEILTDNPH